MADYFISYTASDESWALWIAWELEREGYSCIVQALDFVPGADFVQQMGAASTDAAQTIAVLSPDFAKSDFASAEWHAAFVADPVGERALLVPVRVRECEPPRLLLARHYIDLVGLEEEAARRKLLRGIRASRVASHRPSSAVRFPGKPVFPGAHQAKPAPRRAQPAERPYSLGQRVLFLGADAGAGLDLEREYLTIETLLNSSSQADKVVLTGKFEVTGQDLVDALDEHRPGVFHFSGNMDGESILLPSERSGVMAVSDEALVGILQELRDDVRLVVLNACRSLPCAEKLAEAIDCAIGIAGDITDTAAITFTEWFYGYLFGGQSVMSAFNRARSRLLFDGVPQSEAPRLLKGPGADAKSLRF
jgi:hypothetical protein